MEGERYGEARPGSFDAWTHIGVETVAHEAGHLVEGASYREAAASHERPGARRRCARAAWRDMLRALLVEAGGQPSPSDYGVVTAREGFAEYLAFFALHPDYLERAHPQVHAWFTEARPLTVQRQAYAACLHRKGLAPSYSTSVTNPESSM